MSELYGSKETVHDLGNGSTVGMYSLYRAGQVERTLKKYKLRVRVNNSQEEMAEFIRFTKDLRSKEKAGLLAVDKSNPDTFPCFIIEPGEAHTIVKCWAEIA